MTSERHSRRRSAMAAAMMLAAVLFTGGPAPAAPALEPACGAAITVRIGAWTLTSVRPDVRAFARAWKFDPVRVEADLDGDGRRDLALLIQARPVPLAANPERFYASRVAVCFARASGVELHLIVEPYCTDYIEHARKGETYHDIDAGVDSVYPAHGVRTVCFEAASATYLWERGGFRQIVDGD